MVVANHAVDEILIAIVSLSGSRMREVIQICQSTGKRFRTIPALGDLVDGKVTVSQLREVVLEDLLGRQPVEIDLENIRMSLAGKVVLVTGAAGSIGSELCEQILSYQPSKLLCVDQDESALFYLNERLQNHAGSEHVEYVVADIADRRRVREVLLKAGVDVAFHAAAYKHVPMMESNVSEAVRNNIFGLTTLLEEAEQAGCASFVMISSDKAVHPTSVMGCTKRVGELILAARPEILYAVRIGALRQRTGLPGQRGSHIQGTDHHFGPRYGYASGDHPIFHDDTGSGVTGLTSLHGRKPGRDYGVGHGRAHSDCRLGANTDQSDWQE